MGWMSRAMDAIRGETHTPEPDVVPMPKSSDTGTPAGNLFSRMAATLMPGMGQDDAERELLRCYAHVAADGADMDARIAVEAPLLASLSPDDLADRFEYTTLPRMDPYPDDALSRLEWIEDVLRSERQDIIDGRINLREALRIAAFDRGGVPDHIAVEAPATRSGMARRTDDQIALQAQQMMNMPMQMLRRRFAAVGGDRSPIPMGTAGLAPLEWIRSGLKAEDARTLSRMPPLTGTGESAWSDPLSITMRDIDIATLHGGVMAFSGMLYVDEAPICRIHSQADGTLIASLYAPGCDAGTIGMLEEYAAAAVSRRDDGEGERATTLDDLILDRISTHIAVMEYRTASCTALLFCPDIEVPQPRLASVRIPDGGNRDEAADHVRAVHPRATMLDELPEDVAALLWISLNA